MNYLVNALRQLTIEQVENRMEVYRRFFIFPNIWISKFGNEGERARAALEKITTEAAIKGVNYYDLIADGLIGKYNFDQFILENMDDWLECVKYLAYGNSEVERGLTEGTYQMSTQIALNAIRQELLCCM